MQPLPSPLLPAEGNQSAFAPNGASRMAVQPVQASAPGLEARLGSFPAHLSWEDDRGGSAHGSGHLGSLEAGKADHAQDARADRNAEADAIDSVGDPFDDSDGIAQAMQAASLAEAAGSRSSSKEGLEHEAQADRPYGQRGARRTNSAEEQPGNSLRTARSSGGAQAEATSNRLGTASSESDGSDQGARSKQGAVVLDEDVDASARERAGSKRPEARGQERSLDALLEKHAGSSGRSSENAPHPAIARAEQIQQMIALEHAAQQGGRLPQGGLQTFALEAGADEGRQNVLADLLTREGAQLKADARTRMLTARAMGALASQRGGTLTMRLDPPGLGELGMRMTVMDGVVRAELTTTNSVARALLEQGLEMLRATLETRGLHVERLSVQGPTGGSESSALRSDAHAHESDGHQEDGGEDARKDAAGRESRGRGGAHREDDSEAAGPAEGTFQEAMERD